MTEGLHTLRLGVYLGAIHDSAERYPPPNCHPDTRKAVRQIILDWIGNEGSASSFFWFYGPAGAGKKRASRQLQSFCVFHLDPIRILEAAFSFPEGAIKAIFCSQQSHIHLLWPRLRQYVDRIIKIKSNTLYKVNGRTATNPYCRCVPIFITLSTMFLSCHHRRIRWMPRQGDPTVDSPTPVQDDKPPLRF